MRSHADIIDTIEWEVASREPADAAAMLRDIAAHCTRRANQQDGDVSLLELAIPAS